MAGENPDIDYRVTLRNSNRPAEACTFPATPDLIETRNVNYKTIEPIHAPGQILAYAATASRSFNISSIKLISRTPREAQLNLRKLWLLRSWTMPRFGRSTLTETQRENREFIEQFGRTPEEREQIRQDLEAQGRVGDPNADALGVELRGQPPAVLLLSAYSRRSSAGSLPNGRNSQAEHINRVPVVIQNLSIPFPSDVDYIPTEDSNVPMPTIMTLDMTLMETHSPSEYESFSLSAFKNGNLAGF